MLFDQCQEAPELFEAAKLMIFLGFIGFLVQKASKYPRPLYQTPAATQSALGTDIWAFD